MLKGFAADCFVADVFSAGRTARHQGIAHRAVTRCTLGCLIDGEGEIATFIKNNQIFGFWGRWKNDSRFRPFFIRIVRWRAGLGGLTCLAKGRASQQGCAKPQGAMAPLLSGVERELC